MKMNHVIRKAALVTMLLSMGAPSRAAETVTGKQAIEKASGIFKEVIRRREAIQSIEFTATITCDLFRYDTPEIDREFEGATAEYHFWKSSNVCRVDVTEMRPRAPQRRDCERAAWVDNVLRWVPCGIITVAEEVTPVSRRASAVGGGLLGMDERLIGLFPDEFRAIQVERDEKSLSGMKNLLDHLQSFDVKVTSEQSIVTISASVRASQGPPGAWQYTIRKDDMVPTKIRTEGWAGPGTIAELSTSWIKHDGIALPASAEYSSSRDEGSTPWRRERWKFQHISLNRPIPKEVATWKSMGLRENQLVQFRTPSIDSRPRIREWRNGTFVEFDQNKRNFAKNQPSLRRWDWKMLVLITNLCLLGALFIAIGVRRYLKVGL
jgi:hypothetical protein